MSRDLTRLVDVLDPPTPEAEFLRDIIRAQEGASPPDAKIDELARRLSPLMREAPPPPRSRTWLTVAAIAVVATAIAAGTLSTRDSSGTARPPTVAPQPRHDDQPPSATVALDPPVAPVVSVDALPNAEVRKAPPVPSVAAAPLCDDVALVDAADTSLRAGDPARALAITRDHERRCPTGALVQERERIAIEALIELGQSEQARARARGFTERFPSSPHVARIRQALERSAH
jgi:hypothetical protein